MSKFGTPVAIKTPLTIALDQLISQTENKVDKQGKVKSKEEPPKKKQKRAVKRFIAKKDNLPWS